MITDRRQISVCEANKPFLARVPVSIKFHYRNLHIKIILLNMVIYQSIWNCIVNATVVIGMNDALTIGL